MRENIRRVRDRQDQGDMMGFHGGQVCSGRWPSSVALALTVGIALTLGQCAAPLRAQLATGWPPGNNLTFDVASVKQNKSGDKPTSNVPLGVGTLYSPTGGFLSATNIPLVTYIAFAYKLTGNQVQFLRRQLPEWVITDRFDIQARVAGNPTKDEMRLMMRSLLADRYKLAIHSEVRQLPVFALVLLKPGKFGPQLKPHPDGAPCPTESLRLPPAGSVPAPPLPVTDGFPTTCGTISNMLPSASGRLRSGARNVSIGLIGSSLTIFEDLGRPVLDQTGLSGTFDFALEWTPEVEGSLPPGVDFQPDPSGSNFMQALKEQLGLKLESKKGPIDVFILDYIERPSVN